MSKLRNILLACLLLLFALVSSTHTLWALEKDTHEFLNKKIVRNYSILNSYLKEHFVFSKGIEEILVSGNQSKTIEEWIGIGGKYEDEPMNSRSFNHFHNPLQTWDSAGFKGTFQSAVLWAQDQGSLGSFFGGNYSWKAAREYFYIALTGKDFNGTVVAPTQTEKERYFSDVFRGLGQIMHLVQDMSVPAHTRNDAHVIGYHYEKAVEYKIRKNRDANIRKIFEDAVANPVTFDSSILTFTPNPLASIPIAKVFDTDIYYNTNSDPNVTALDTIGLSEYTNANFVSEGLIAANLQDFPYPRIENTSIVPKLYTGTLGTYTRQYHLKNCCGETNAGSGYLLAVVDYLEYWRQKFPLLSAGLPIIPVMDENVYRDYASLLLPRAVGYSAGLLNYFLRGTVEITLPKSGVYSFTDNPATGFTRINLLAKNTTSTGEEMNDGSIELVVGYKRAQADPFQSGLVPLDGEFTYIVAPEANNIRYMPKNSPTELTFNLTQGLPLNATNVYLQIIYKGRLGNENRAVAVGFKDISEPTPVDIFNNMDRICLYNNCYVAGSSEAIELVDRHKPQFEGDINGNHNKVADEWDVYAHDLQDIYIKFSPVIDSQNASPAAYNYYVPYLSAGNISRALFILSDYQFNYSFNATRVTKDPNDPWTHLPLTDLFSGTAIKRQTDYEDDNDLCGGEPPCYLDYYPALYSFRGVEMWWGGGVIYRNYPYPSDSQCPDSLL